MTIMLVLRRLALVAMMPALTACDVRVGDKGVSVGIMEGTASDEWTRSYAIAPGGQVEVLNGNGAIEVFPSAGPEVEIRALREARSRSDEAAREMLKQMTVAEDVAPDRVRVETKQPREGGFLERVRVTYRVSVPPGLSVSVRSERGGVRLENVEGRFTAASTNGTINGRGVSGAVDASTVNGAIAIELAEVTGDTRLTTVNGGVRLDIGPGVNAMLEASAVNGGVVIREGFPIETTERERLRVAGRINDGGPTIVVQTTNGGIVLGGGIK